MDHFPNSVQSAGGGGSVRFALGHPLVDSYLAFVAGRCRPNTARAVAHDLKTFFTVVDRDPVEISSADVFEFLAHERGDRKVIPISDGESALPTAIRHQAMFGVGLRWCRSGLVLRRRPACGSRRA